MEESGESSDCWVVLVVDDEAEVHAVTKMVLGEFSFAGKPLEIISAYSAVEACQVMASRSDIAVMLIDVFMGKTQAGMEVIRYVREVLENHFVQIVIRTSQPEKAPEVELIEQYDINGYRLKDQLTSKKLFSLMYSCLRSYRNITTIGRQRDMLKQVAEAMNELSQQRSDELFVRALIRWTVQLLQLDSSGFSASYIATSHNKGDHSISVTAGGGIYQSVEGKLINDIEEKVRALLLEAFRQQQSIYDKNAFVIYCTNSFGDERVIYFLSENSISRFYQGLLKRLLKHASSCFSNISRKERYDRDYLEIIALLCSVIEGNSDDRGGHIYRVAEYSAKIALLLGLAEDTAEMLKMAAPLHDIGKVLIPEESESVSAHAEAGYNLLKKYDSETLQVAAMIALQHHEHWNGAGCPQQLKGEAIHIYARIVALADTFDELANRQGEQEAWPLDKILNYMVKERGAQFDPELVDLLLEHIEEFTSISK